MLGSYALQAPEAVAEESSDNAVFAAVDAHPYSYLGHQVRWGGMITAVENWGTNDTVLIIAKKTLDSQGKPLADAGNQGQFMARVNGFLSPTVYAKGQFVTVAGTIVGSESRAIDDNPDSYPFITVNDYSAWPEWQPTSSYHGSCKSGMSPYPDTSFGYGQNFDGCR